MTVFIVTARENSPDLESAIARGFPNKFYRFSDRTWFVSAKGTAREISEAINVKKGGITGVVVFPSTGSYYGVANSALWDWLKVAVEEGDNG